MRSAAVVTAVGDDLIQRLKWLAHSPTQIIDIGAGTSCLSAKLSAVYPLASLWAIEGNFDLLTQLSLSIDPVIHPINAAAEFLPFRANSIDLIYANLFLPWHSNVFGLFREWQRVLKPNGVLALTVLGLDTLRELSNYSKQLFSDPDSMVILPKLVDVHDLGDALIQAKFVDPVLDVDYYTTVHKDPFKLRSELAWTNMLISAPAAHIASSDNLNCNWQLTYEVIFAHAFKPVPKSTASCNEDGLVQIACNQIPYRDLS